MEKILMVRCTEALKKIVPTLKKFSTNEHSPGNVKINYTGEEDHCMGLLPLCLIVVICSGLDNFETAIGTNQ